MSSPVALSVTALSALPSSVPMHPEPVRFSAEQADEVIAAIGDALADTELTIDELTEAIVDRTGPWAGEQTMEAFGGRWPRWRQLTSTAAHRGMLCFGPNRGPRVTYTNPHRWLPGFRPDDGDAALRTLELAPLTSKSRAAWVVRLRYAYADTLEAAGRESDALAWFHRTHAIDSDELTDSAERAELLERRQP